MVLFFIVLTVFSGNGQATSFPFRGLRVGESVPDAGFEGYKGEETKSISSFGGKPLLVVLWGGDMEAKKKRAVKTLKIVQQLEPYLKEKEVAVFCVNMLNDDQKVVDEITGLSGMILPVYRDVSREAYKSFGVYVLPSLLLVNSSGKVSGGIGYSKDMAQRLRGEVDVMLGLLSRSDLEAALNPVMKEMPKEKKLARRHMQMGVVMKRKGIPGAALREFLKALELDPSLQEARIELGCLYLEKGDLDAAVKELELGLESDPDSIEAEICLAGVSAEMGGVEEAIMDLQALLFRNSRNSDLHYAIGTLLERQKKHEEAARSYRKAFELLQRKTLLND